MKKEEANKVIAEFMGIEIDFAKNGCVLTCTKDRWWYPVNYHLSLDALVPVWEKIDINSSDNYIGKSTDAWFFQIVLLTGVYDHSASTIQEAAAIATAKAIQELNKQRSTEGTEVQHD